VARLYLGVDGGGTNCRVSLADSALNVLAEVRNGRSNLQIDDGEPAFRAISEGTRDVFAAAGIDYAETANTYACFGMAGGRMDSARAAFAARPWPFAGVKVYDDIDIAHAGALGGEDGAVIIVGTGSAALAIVAGQRLQAGGWGFQIGDQMSGAILGRELVRWTVEAEDGLRPASPLTRAVTERLGGSNQAVMSWSFAAEKSVRIVAEDGSEGHEDLLIGRAPAEFGKLMPLFIEHYEAGDPVAAELMTVQLNSIDRYVDWFKARGATRMAVVGGFGQRLFSLLQQRYGGFVMLPLFEPLHGALILARQHFPDA
jgi:glucosamine kinase